MPETDFYQQILGLKSPWKVVGVKLDTAAGQVDIHVAHPDASRFCCPECGKELACYDHSPERRWRDLDTMQFKTILHASPPCVNCLEYGVKQVQLPWAEKERREVASRCSLSDLRSTDVLLATQTVKGAQGILRTS